VNALKYELDLFAKAVTEGTQPLVTAEDGRRALEVAQIIMDKIGQQTVRM